LYADYQNLIQPVARRAEQQPDHLALIFLGEDGSAKRITASAFYQAALAYAHMLASLGIAHDDLVILVLKHSEVLLSAFWGAMALGAIPSIFPFLTEKLDPAIYVERVRVLVAHSGARAVITSPELLPQMSEVLSGVGCQVISTDSVAETTQGLSESVASEYSSEKIAFLQHSSGTTGLQKGVALSHRAVLNHIDAYSHAIDLQPDDVVASWLPLYHDMGLIAGFVMPVTAGIPLVLMSPFHWVRSPKILFEVIRDHHATLCWLPNFAYNHCVRGVRQRDLDGIDVGHLRAIINCSEPVHHTSHQLFVQKFGTAGIRESMLATCYAMAENTFAVTQSAIGAPPHVDWIHLPTFQEEHKAVTSEADAPGAFPMVSCGTPIEGAEVAAIDAAGNRLADREEGEVIVRSNSMLTEYYKRPDLTEAGLIDGWYRTGDMGYLAEGHLYISGRKKDLIIVGGKNVYPQDMEAIANQVPGIYPGRAVAFGVEDEELGTESIVIVAELEQPESNEDALKQIASDLRQRVVHQTEVTLADVRLVDQRWVIKTSSGKIARADNRAKYLREFRAG
jgi:acyl-CoA synthetase (AMP-forming)/AMP-acid ligase II